MSAFDRYGRLPIELPDLLTDIAAPRVPDYVDDVLAITAGTRQRPRWTFLKRWLPMRVLATERVSVRSPIPWRTLAAVALVILALVAAGLFYAGSQRHLPAPFGPARNGALVFGDANGDIAIRDTLDGSSRLLVGGPTDDFAANFTRDGTHLIWLRRVAGSPGSADERLTFVVANPDGSNARQLPASLEAPDMWDISADGSTVVAETGDPAIGKKLVLIDLVGNTGQRPLDVGDPAMTMSTPSYLGPDGKEIVFRGRTSVAAGLRAGLFAVHPDGTGLRPLTPTDAETDAFYLFPQVSQDGRYVTYTDWDNARQLNSIHVVDLTTGVVRPVDPGTTRNEGFASFSPDTRYLLFLVYDGPSSYLMVEPVDGSSPARQIGPTYAQVDGAYLSGRFSADAQWILVVNEGSKETRLVDVEGGGDGRVIDYASADVYAVQRLAQ
jgi:hypothetical protein